MKTFFQSLFILLILPMMFISCGISQEGEIPKAVIEAFEAKYPNEKSPSWSVDSHGYFEAKFKKDGESFRADFDKSGSWIETENDMKFSDLPEAVQNIIKAQFDKDDISEIEGVDHPTKGRFYDIEFKQKGKNRDVEINAAGEIIGGNGE